MQNPLDPFVPPTSITPAHLRAWTDALAAFPRSLRAVAGGLSDAQLDTPFRDGGWTARQIVHHVADSHANAHLRVRWALTEERTTVKPFDQDRWAELSDARAAPVEHSLALVEAVHGRLVALLSRLEARDFARPFLHPETGPSTVAGIVALYAWHGPHHLAQIEALAQRSAWSDARRAHVHAESFPAAPERLFDLLVTPSAIRAWWSARSAIVVPESGGMWAATWGGSEDDPDYATSATIAAFDRPRRLVFTDYRYRAKSGPLPFRGDFTTSFEVLPDPERQGASILRVTQDGFPAGAEADAFLASCEDGWRATFAGIRAFLGQG